MDPKRVESLIACYLSGQASESEYAELDELLRKFPEIRKELIEHVMADRLLQESSKKRLDPQQVLDLIAKTGSTAFADGIVQRISQQREGGRSPSLSSEQPEVRTRRVVPSTRRTRPAARPSVAGTWALSLAAAGILLAVIVFSLGPSKPDPDFSNKASVSGMRASQEAEARRQAERDERERELAQAEAKARRLQAEARLRELEEKRRALTQVKPEAAEGAQAKEKREKDLDALKRDQERIEQELREAAELAKKTERPVPVAPQEEKPLSPKDAPAGLLQGTTLAPLAKVEEVSGEAFSVTKDAKSPVTAGANLLPGQGFVTGGGASRIVLRFPDKTRVDLGADSVLAELKIDSGKRFNLTQGSVRAVVAKQPKGEPLIFTTPHGQATVVGTTLRLVVDPDAKKGTKLDVEEGKVELKNLAGKTVMVESGHYAVAAVGVDLVARMLPPRPGLAAYIGHGPHVAWGAILQTVAVVPGQTYTLSVWIQTSTPDPARSTGQFPGGSIGVRTESGSILGQEPFGQSGSYTRTILTFKAGSTSTAVIFAGFANGTDLGAWIHLDDWSLVQKGGDGTNLIQDPDYEGQNPAGGPLSGPWFTEGPLSDGRGNQLIGVDYENGHMSVKETARRGLSPNGSVIYGGQRGTLMTPEGTWTFGGLASDGVDYYTLLNGVTVGWACQLQVTNGSVYAMNKTNGIWFLWKNDSWIDEGTTPPGGKRK